MTEHRDDDTAWQADNLSPDRAGMVRTVPCPEDCGAEGDEQSIREHAESGVCRK